MRVLIRDMFKTVGINIYGLDGNEHTDEFFEKYLSRSERIHRTPDDERELYQSDAEWTIESIEDFNEFKRSIYGIQRAIDEIRTKLIDGDNIENYTFSGECYLV